MFNKQTKTADKEAVAVKREAGGALATVSPDSVLQFGQQASAWLESLPKNVSAFYQAYQRPLVYFAYLLAVIVTFKLLAEVLGAVAEVPMLAPILKLVGISYSAWFASRYLVSYEKRKELGMKINELKSYFLGS